MGLGSVNLLGFLFLPLHSINQTDLWPHETIHHTSNSPCFFFSWNLRTLAHRTKSVSFISLLENAHVLVPSSTVYLYVFLNLSGHLAGLASYPLILCTFCTMDILSYHLFLHCTTHTTLSVLVRLRLCWVTGAGLVGEVTIFLSWCINPLSFWLI